MQIRTTEHSPFPGIHSIKTTDLWFSQHERTLLNKAARLLNEIGERLRLFEGVGDGDIEANEGLYMDATLAMGIIEDLVDAQCFRLHPRLS